MRAPIAPAATTSAGGEEIREDPLSADALPERTAVLDVGATDRGTMSGVHGGVARGGSRRRLLFILINSIPQHSANNDYTNPPCPHR